MSPIEEMARRAQEITLERLDARLANDYVDDELRQLHCDDHGKLAAASGTASGTRIAG